jgi:hypothetical protein
MRGCLLIAALLFASPANAQPSIAQAPMPDQPDTPLGAPYRVGSIADNAQVPLRDFLSARIDNLRTELMGLLNERDRQYMQRFTAQELAVDRALGSAKEAVVKAEDAANKRFDGVNEFRKTLSDQALTFLPKAEAEIRFKALEAIAASNIGRLDALKASGEGAGNLWAYIIGVIGLIGIVVSIYTSFSVRPRQSGRA